MEISFQILSKGFLHKIIAKVFTKACAKQSSKISKTLHNKTLKLNQRKLFHKIKQNHNEIT